VKSSHPGCGDFCFFRAVIQRSPFTRPVSIFLSKQYRFPVHLFYIHLSPA